jgi:eukaryotic-like serine/threonine-protein kinase
MVDNFSGKTLGRYQLKALLGEGGMGMVFRAYDPNLHRDVAIKVMHPHLLRMPGFKERFLQEAIVAARLQHPGIVQVHDSGEADGVLYIVMAFIQGGNLSDLLDDLRVKGEWVPLREAVEIVQQVSAALDYAHRHGVLHRDIKPGNIMLECEPSGGLPYRPVLTDLGLAKLLEGGVETQTGVSMGTPAYMSPEQAQGLPVDARSDVYSLGALLYHLCTGQLPFPAKTISDAIRYHVQAAPPPPSQVNPRVTREIELTILKTLEKDPARRFSDAAQFAAVLGKLLTILPAQQPGDSTAVEPAAKETGVRSLATMLEQSIVKQRGASVLNEFPLGKLLTNLPAQQAGQDQIQMIEPGKTARTLPLNTQVITVGRTAENQIVLDDPKVSRVHLRIERTGSGYQVTDLGSSNGSFLGGVKLLKGVAQAWDPAQPLKVGDTYFKLLQARETPGTQADPGTMPAQRMSELAEYGRFSVTLDKAQLAVEPGSSAPLAVRVLNQGSQVDHYRLSIEGVLAIWVKNLPDQPVRCMPGQEQIQMVYFQPPRSPESRAGHYSLAVAAACQQGKTQVVRASATLTIAPYRQFSGSLVPERIRSGKPGRILLTNQGNTPETFQVSWSDPASELVFNPPQAKVKAEPGQAVEVEFSGRPRRGRLVGGEKTHRFKASISPLQAGQAQAQIMPQSLPGEITSRGSLPAWLIPLFLSLCVLLGMGAGAFYALVYLPQVNATQVAWTQEAQATMTTVGIAFLNSDPDNDGLSNAREAKYDTNPNNPDTDNDGLPDGLEVDSYHTDPKNQDSDGDTWTDGYEINTSHTNPLNRDTDGDGAQDNVDPDPGHLPTATPIPTFTPTSTSSPTPTREPTLTRTPVPPHAPAITKPSNGNLYDEKVQLVPIPSGGQVTLEGQKLWSAPVGAEPSCASGGILFTWAIRAPNPADGSDLEFHDLVPQSDGRTEKIGGGLTGSASIGYCNEIIIKNIGLKELKVELRYASLLN